MLRTRLTNFGFVLLLLLISGAFALFGKDSSIIIGAAIALALPLLLMLFGRSKLPFHRNIPWILLGMIGAASFCLYGEEVNSNFEVLGRYYYRLIDFVGDSTGNLLMTLVPIIVVVVLRLVSGKHAFPPLTLLRYMALAFFLIVLDEAKLPAPLILGLCVVFGCMFRELTASVYEPKPCLHLAFLLLAILYLVYPPILGYNLTAKIYDAIVSPSLITAGIAVVLGGACILDSNGETDRTHAATRLLEGQHMAMTFFAFAVLDLFFYALPALWSPYVLVLGIPAARMVLEYAGSRMTVERGQAPTARFGKTAAGFGIALAVLPALSRSLTNPDGRYIGRWEFMICLFVLITAWYIVARVVKAESPSDTMHYFWGVASILTLFCVFGLREATLMRILVLVFLIALWVLLNVFLRRPGFQSKDLYKQENHYPLLVMHWSPVALLGLSVIILYFL